MVLVERRLPEMLGIDGRADGVHVAAQKAGRKPSGDEQALAAGRVDGVVYRVVLKRRRDLAGLDSSQLIGTRDAIEGQVGEVLIRGVAQGLDARNIVTIRQAEA